MTHYLPTSRIMHGLLAAAIAAVISVGPAHASPGAHGPNGEHLDAPDASRQYNAGTSVPRMETASETFELVARLNGGELSVLIDRFETNEPVFGAQLEVESYGIKASGTFHGDHGDYAFTDERLLKALSQSGKHPLVFTIFAGDDSDLLEGTLDVNAMQEVHDDGHRSVSPGIWVAGTGLALALMAGAFWISRRSGKTKTGRNAGPTGS